MAVLVVFSGLPGTGKSSIARAVAARSGAVWLRIDSIEQAIRDADPARGTLNDAGYRAAFAAAEDNLRLGRDVVGDSVNPWMRTRDAWRDVGLRAGAAGLEVETVCSDLEELRRRVETRTSDVPGLVLPDWRAVIERDYHPWKRRPLVLDTAALGVPACVDVVVAAMARLRR